MALYALAWPCSIYACMFCSPYYMLQLSIPRSTLRASLAPSNNQTTNTYQTMQRKSHNALQTNKKSSTLKFDMKWFCIVLNAPNTVVKYYYNNYDVKLWNEFTPRKFTNALLNSQIPATRLKSFSFIQHSELSIKKMSQTLLI